MMAKRDLNAGEELFLDYELNESVLDDQARQWYKQFLPILMRRACPLVGRSQNLVMIVRIVNIWTKST